MTTHDRIRGLLIALLAVHGFEEIERALLASEMYVARGQHQVWANDLIGRFFPPLDEQTEVDP